MLRIAMNGEEEFDTTCFGSCSMRLVIYNLLLRGMNASSNFVIRSIELASCMTYDTNKIAPLHSIPLGVRLVTLNGYILPP